MERGEKAWEAVKHSEKLKENLVMKMTGPSRMSAKVSPEQRRGGGVADGPGRLPRRCALGT